MTGGFARRGALFLLAALAGLRAKPAPAQRLAGRRVAVLGAGMAGAKAARDLIDAGAEVVIVEAKSRVGGRVWTDRGFGVPIERGASWIHGIERNPLAALARRLGEPTRLWDDERSLTLGPGGAPIDPWPERERWLEAFWPRALRLNARSPRASVADALADARAMFRGADDAEIARFAYAMIELSHAVEADRLALADALIDSFGGPDVILPEGYDRLIEALLGGVAVERDNSVAAIRATASGVRLETARGLRDADAVVVTAPLGVLKEGAIAFDPPLPAIVDEAIDSLDMALMNKVFLRFAEPFWPADIIEFELGGAAPFTHWMIVDERTLCGFATGRAADMLEELDDRRIVEKAREALAPMRAGARAPEPDGVAITRWRSDPWARGSYSYLRAGGRPDARAVLAGPFGPILFAGEATAFDHPSTVHGAYLSGARAAARIIAGRAPRKNSPRLSARRRRRSRRR